MFLQRLVDMGYSVDMGLAFALESEKPALVRYFIKRGANPNGSLGAKTMLTRAIDAKEHWKLMTILLDAGAKPSSDALQYAVKANKPMAVSKLLEYNILPGNRIIKLARDRGYTVIHGMLNRVAKVVDILPKCKNLSVHHVDTRKKSQYNAAHIANVIERDLKVCTFSDNILHDFISGTATDFFFAFDSDGTCVAGASVDLFSHVNGGTMLYVNYLCSSKKCSGAGSILMKAMETFAKDNGMLFVGLTSTPKSRTFYPKLGYVRVAGAIGPASNSAGATRSVFKRHSQFIKRLR